MKMFVKKIIDAKWGHEEFIVFKEGEYQTPVAILSELELKYLQQEIKNAIEQERGSLQ